MGRPSKLTEAQRKAAAWEFFAQACNSPIEPQWIIVNVGELTAEARRARMTAPITIAYTHRWSNGPQE
jgi:hypothetical protein